MVLFLAMTLNPANRQGLSKVDAKFLRIIEEFGWHVMTVAPRVDEEGDIFAYSSGLFHSFGHPEVIIFNLDLNSLQNAVNAIGKQAKSGIVHKIDTNYSGIVDDRDCQFRMVDRSQYREHLGYSIWFYEGMDFPALQAFWPDEAGNFAWSEGSDGWITTTQPRLDLPMLKQKPE
jgi:hypothetical protein